MNDCPDGPYAGVADARDEALRQFSNGVGGIATAEALSQTLDACLVSAVAWRPDAPWALLALGS